MRKADLSDTPSNAGHPGARTAADVHIAPFEPDENEALHARALSIYSFIGRSLEGGPHGIHPPTFVSALAAVAGYAANRAVSARIARGEIPDDFRRITQTSAEPLIVSEQVETIVLAMDRPSIASIVIGAALRAGLSALPDLEELRQTPGNRPVERRHFTGIAAHQLPEVPPETLMMMYWEGLSREFRTSPRALEAAPLAAATASAEAINNYRQTLPIEVGLRLAISTSIGMSRTGRAF